MLKQCSACKESKEEVEFYPKMGRCKSCHKIKCIEWQKQHPDKVKAASIKWRSKPGSREKELLASIRWNQNNIERRKLTRRRKELRGYGLTLDDYISLYNKQAGKCSICQNWFELLHVDHNHSTNVIRELLCSNCNTALGLLKEDPNLFHSAVSYLNKHSKEIH